MGISVLLLLWGCGASSGVAVECYYLAQAVQRTLPACETYTLCVNTKEGTRLDVYLQIKYSSIHFEKDLEIFKGSYTASFVFRDDDDAVVRTKEVDRPIVARSYGESVSPMRDAFVQTFILPPAHYKLDITITDNGSGLRYRRRRMVEARDFPKDRFSASDALFFEHVERGGKAISLRPLFPSGISFARDSIGIFQELYDVHRGDTVRLSLSYMCAKRGGLESENPGSVLSPYRLRLPQCSRSLDSAYYASDSVIVPASEGTMQIFQLFPKPAEGVTSIVRRVRREHFGVTDSSVQNERIAVFAPTFPLLPTVDDEIGAISYIARNEELDSARAGASPGERRVRLDKFWQNHGGEIRQREYYERVKEANELFTSCVEGWKTPMGITYIVCGPPDYVECQGAMNEVWYYDIGGNRGFTVPFKETLENNLGRFFEIVPFAVNDFMWQEFVDRWRRQ